MQFGSQFGPCRLQTGDTVASGVLFAWLWLHRLAAREPGFAEFAVLVSPQMECGPRDFEAAAGRVDVAELLRVLGDCFFHRFVVNFRSPRSYLPSAWQGVQLDL